MKKLIIAFVVLVLILGISVGVMKALQMGPFEPPPEANAEEEKKPDVPDEDDISRLEIKNLIVTVFNGSTVAGTFQLDLALEVEKDRLSELNEFKDRVTSEILTDLHSFIPRMLRYSENLDIQTLADRVELVAERHMGKDSVYQVLVTKVINTPR